MKKKKEKNKFNSNSNKNWNNQTNKKGLISHSMTMRILYTCFWSPLIFQNFYEINLTLCKEQNVELSNHSISIKSMKKKKFKNIMTVDNPFYFGENEILLLLLPSQSMIIGMDRQTHTHIHTNTNSMFNVHHEWMKVQGYTPKWWW